MPVFKTLSRSKRVFFFLTTGSALFSILVMVTYGSKLWSSVNSWKYNDRLNIEFISVCSWIDKLHGSTTGGKPRNYHEIVLA